MQGMFRGGDLGYDKKELKDPYDKGWIDAMEYIAEKSIDNFVANKQFDIGYVEGEESYDDDDENPMFLTKNEKKRIAKQKSEMLEMVMESFKDFLETETEDFLIGMLEEQPDNEKDEQ